MVLYFAVWRWKGDVLKNYLLHKYWQEGSVGLRLILQCFYTFFFQLLFFQQMIGLYLLPSCKWCRLLRQMLDSSLNLFAERFVAFHGNGLLVLVVGWICILWEFSSHHFGWIYLGSTLEASWRLPSLNSNCICWVHYGNYLLTLYVHLNQL